MKHYTETIREDLAEKLKGKGMPIEMQPLYAQEAPNVRGIVKAGVGLKCPTYADTIDWLSENNIIILNAPCYNDKEDEIVGWVASVDLVNKVLGDNFTFGFDYEEHLSWHEAANAAIEKALELIKED